MTKPSSSFRVAVVLLAAGASSRMGKAKMLLPWGSTSVVGHLIASWRQLGVEQIAIVCAANDPAINIELDRLAFPDSDRITNSKPERGMFSSIQCAVQWKRWNQSLTHWALVLGDQPHLPASVLRSLLDFARERPEKICQPSRNGRPRHPVLLPAIAFQKLATSSEENLKQFLQGMSGNVELLDIDDPALDMDLDTPADYEQARRFAEEREKAS